MAEQMKASDVAAWVEGVLTDYRGRYEVQDQLFIRNAVRVVTVRRDAFFDIHRDRWLDTTEPDARELLGQELRVWARRVMPTVATPQL
jgi:hypothetical protein